MLTHNTSSESIDLTRTYIQQFDIKPIGLWYAMDNDWIKWVKTEGMPWIYPNDFTMKLDKTDILVLDSIADFKNFNTDYTVFNSFISIDWVRVADKYKGIEIPNYNKVRHHFFDMPMTWILTWDVNSGCVWDLSAIVSIDKL